MTSEAKSPRVVRFGAFELDLQARELRKSGIRVRIYDQPFQILAALVERPGEIVTRDELRRKLWPTETFVDFDHSINTAVNRLRELLGDSADHPRFVETLARRGYRFIAPVHVVDNGGRIEFQGPQQRSPEAGIPASFMKHHKAVIGMVGTAVVVIAVAWSILRRAPKPSPELTQRRLTFNSSANSVSSAAISPDGKYLAYSDLSGIHVKLLSTGEERLIPTPAGVPSAVLSYVDSWFPDGTQLLAHSNDTGGHGSMWTISVIGQSPRQLRANAAGWQVSPDGTHIVFSPTKGSDSFREIWVMDSQGENPRRILAVGVNEWLWSVRWSPDGQRLAFIRAQRLPDKYLQFTETCDLNGANQRVVVAVSDTDPWVQDIAWLPDGRILYSQLESPGSSDANLWQIAVNPKRGTPSGKSKQITHWAGSNLIGLSASADAHHVVLQRVTSHVQVLLAELTAGGRRMSSPRRLTTDEANDAPSAWTKDSKTVIFMSDRNGRPDLFKQAISSDAAEPLVTGPKAVDLARLSPDGAWVLYMETSWSPTAGHFPPFRLMRVPVNGGFPQFVLETRKWWNFQCALASGSVCVIGEMSQDEKRLTLTTFDPLRGRGKVLRVIEKYPGAPNGSGLSPDGSTFAIGIAGQGDMHVRFLSMSGGDDREITLKGWRNSSGLDWSADGRGLYCGFASPQGATLVYVDLKGTVQVLWHDMEANGTGFIAGAPSPDGRHIAIWSGVHNSNVWALEGL